MSSETKIKLSFIFIIFLFALGTSGYYFIEGWSILDSFFMTLITISTIGYGEIQPLSPQGRIFTSFLIITGVGTAGYTLGSITELFLEGQFGKILKLRKMNKEIRRLNDHIIVCGYGRVGSHVCKDLQIRGAKVVVIEIDEKNAQEALEEGFYVLQDDATQDEVLLEAGVERAEVLVSALASDASNVFITLSARGLNPKLYVVVRAESRGSEKKLLRAGASRVIAPYAMGGQKMALSALNPTFVEFMDIITPSGGTGFRIEQLVVKSGSDLSGRSIRDSNVRQRTGVIIIGVKKSDGQLLFNPKPDIVIEGGDLLIVVGNEDQLEKLTDLTE